MCWIVELEKEYFILNISITTIAWFWCRAIDEV